MTPEELKEFREWCRTFEVPSDSMIMKALEHIDQQAAQLAEYRRPMESMDTEQLSQWNVELSTLLCMPVSDRENLWWQIAVGDHLEKFAKSWHSSRIAELEAQIIQQTGISACRIEERERMQKQIATLQEIAEWERASRLRDQVDYETDDEMMPEFCRDARRQLAEEHPEAFG